MQPLRVCSCRGDVTVVIFSLNKMSRKELFMAQLFNEEKVNAENKKRNNFVFLAYPFNPPIDKCAYNKVVKAIEDKYPIRMWYFADEVTTNELMRKVWRAILRADLAIFDVSGGNANVALELGLALASEKNCLSILRSGSDNPLGRADLSYAERVEYDSLDQFCQRLEYIVTNHTACGRLITQVSDQLYHDSGFSKEQVFDKIRTILHRIFDRKFIKKVDAGPLIDSAPLANSIIDALRINGVITLDGGRKGSKWKFTDSYITKDFMVY
jgi:hypothetical protein